MLTVVVASAGLGGFECPSVRLRSSGFRVESSLSWCRLVGGVVLEVGRSGADDDGLSWLRR